MNRRVFLALSFALLAGRFPSERQVTYRLTWGPLHPEFRTSPVDHEDRWGIYVREEGRLKLVRYDQVVR